MPTHIFTYITISQSSIFRLKNNSNKNNIRSVCNNGPNKKSIIDIEFSKDTNFDFKYLFKNIKIDKEDCQNVKNGNDDWHF